MNTPCVIVQIYESSAVGDKNQIIGVVNELKRDHPHWDVVDRPCDKNTDIVRLTAEVAALPIDKKCLVIGIGETAFSVFKALPKNAQLKTLALGHQWTPAYADLLGKITWIAVPDYAIPNGLTNTSTTKIIQTNGVSHALSAESLRAEYDLYKDKFCLMSESDRVVILGGDALGTDNIQKRFTQNDAVNLAKAVARESLQANFYVVNGPRTGKFDENLIEIPGVHKDECIDAVTTAFIEALKSQGVSSARIKLHDFKFSEKSLYVPLIAAAFVHNAIVWVPGESSSMVCEIISNIKPSNIIVYDNNAMNSTHAKHVESVFKQGRARHYLLSGELKNVLPASTAVSLPDARAQIAKIIIE
ncbi:MAG: ELM1/GtrOC1 family putative glycosyltransferase [Candidatus Paracaedibacteraceae bacterium]|nr:ELM1/GtrOC1 family putative glycosyltransferase [Candidatus Paracaedibacteraceae bacterium]